MTSQRQVLPTIWPDHFADRFELIGTLGSSLICRSFLVRQEGRGERLVAEWYFGHRTGLPERWDERKTLSHERLLVPFWIGTCADGSWLGVRHWASELLTPQRGGRDPSELARWLAQAAHALAYLHSLKRLHGVLRPTSLFLDGGANLLLAVGPEYRVDKLPPPSAASAMWSSPERLQGQPLSPSSDLYSLGTVFYQLATGKPPFGSSGGELLRQQISDSIRSPLLLNPRLGLPVARILAKLLRKDPAERFHRANEVIEALNQGMRTHYPTHAASPVRRRIGKARWLEPVEATGMVTQVLGALCRGENHLVLVDAEAGAGRHEFLRRIRAKFREVSWACGLAGLYSRPFAPVFQLLEQLSSRQPDGRWASWKERLTSASVATGAARREMIEAALVSVHRHAPLVLQIDSAELLDPPSLELLCRLLVRSSAGLLVFLSQIRGGDAALADKVLARLGSVPLHRIRLPRLTPDLSAELVRSSIGRVLPSLEAATYRLAGGNPMATRLVLELLVETGELTAEGEGWEFEADGPASALSFGGLVQSFLNAGPEGQKSILQALALFGRPATASEIIRLSGLGEDGADLLRQLGDLRICVSRDGLWQFGDEEIRTRVLAKLEAPRQIELHRRAYSQLLESGAADQELAHHALGFGDYELGARHLMAAAKVWDGLYEIERASELYGTVLRVLESSPLVGRKLEAASKLGHLCLLQGNFSAAQRYIRMTLEHTEDARERLAWLEELGDALLRADDNQAALEIFDEALPLTSENPSARARILANKGWLLLLVGKERQGSALISEALAMVSTNASHEVVSMRHVSLGRLAWVHGDLEEALHHFSSAVVIAREQGILKDVMTQMVNQAILHRSLGQGPQVVELCHQVLRLAEQTGDLFEEARVHNVLGNHYAEQGLSARAVTCYQKALESAERLANDSLAASIAINLANLYKEQGRLEKSLTTYEEACKLVDEVKHPHLMAEFMGTLCEIEFRLGRFEEALSAGRQALQILRRIGQTRGRAWNLYLLGQVEWERCRLQEAKGYYDRARQILQRHPAADWQHALLEIAFAQLFSEEGLESRAGTALRQAARRLDSHRLSVPAAQLNIARARMTAGPEGIVAGDRAVSIVERLGYPELTAMAHAAAGERCLAEGNDLAASRHFDHAVRGLEGLAEAVSDPELRAIFLSTPRRKALFALAKDTHARVLSARG